MKKIKIIKNLIFGLLGVGAVSAIAPFVVSCASESDQNTPSDPHNDSSGSTSGSGHDNSASDNKPSGPTENNTSYVVTSINNGFSPSSRLAARMTSSDVDVMAGNLKKGVQAAADELLRTHPKATGRTDITSSVSGDWIISTDKTKINNAPDLDEIGRDRNIEQRICVFPNSEGKYEVKLIDRKVNHEAYTDYLTYDDMVSRVEDLYYGRVG